MEGDPKVAKVLLVGHEGTGKSALLLRATDDVFTESYLSTIGVDFRVKTFDFPNGSIKLQIWDTAGQERFKTITTAYYRGSSSFGIVFDITNRESFEKVEEFYE